MALPETARKYLERQKERARRLSPRRRIVFPEGSDSRIINAARRLKDEGILEPILVGQRPVEAAKLSEYTRIYYERRRAKGVTEVEAAQNAQRPLYTAALMMAAGDADGFVGGAANTTAETVRAALHCIGPAADVKTVSSVFLMGLPDPGWGHEGMMAFADCAVVLEPSSVELAEIAIATARSTQAMLDAKPLVALLSYSTKGSGTGKRVDLVVEAMRIIRERASNLQVDGELQADAALIAAIGQAKSPGSPVAGRANTLIFPDLTAANIAYKLVERLAGAAAFGPFLQGLGKPASDLSRGCSEDDVYATAILTALQTGGD